MGWGYGSNISDSINLTRQACFKDTPFSDEHKVLNAKNIKKQFSKLFFPSPFFGVYLQSVHAI